MKVECTRGFGIVEHPETGEKINVEEPFETDRETFELLNKEYPGFEVVDDSDPTGGDESDDADNPDTPKCGVNGCSRDVDDPEDTCWQH